MHHPITNWLMIYCDQVFFSIAEHADEYEKERIGLILKLRVLQVKEHGKQCIFINAA